MPEPVARLILLLAGAHVLCGAIFAIAFHARGMARLDDAARDGSAGFRVLVTPGIVLLWPVLLRRWMSGPAPVRSSGPRTLRAAHRVLVQALAMLLPLLVAAALLARAPESPRQSLPDVPHAPIR